MVKPFDFEMTTPIRGNFKFKLGGHHLLIKECCEKVSASGKNMLQVNFDTSEADAQPEYFDKIAKYDDTGMWVIWWPFEGRKYILVEDADGKCNRFFKAFCDAVEVSNPGFHIDWSAEHFGQQFVGLKVGGVFGEAENEYKFKRSIQTQLFWFCPDSEVEQQAIPQPRFLK